MKKFMIFAVMMLMSTAAAFAVNFGFAGVSDVKQVGDKFFAATADGESVEITAWQYRQLSGYDRYYLVSVDDKKVIVAGDEFIVEPLTVDSVGLKDGKPEVFFTNGTSKVFSKDEWLKAQKGQKIRRVHLNTSTWEFENYATVGENEVVIYHDKVAPTKKATALTSAPEAKKEEKRDGSAQSNNTTLPKIKFSVKH